MESSYPRSSRSSRRTHSTTSGSGNGNSGGGNPSSSSSSNTAAAAATAAPAGGTSSSGRRPPGRSSSTRESTSSHRTTSATTTSASSSNNNNNNRSRSNSPTSSSHRMSRLGRGSVDRPLQAEDEYIRSLRKRQQQLQQRETTEDKKDTTTNNTASSSSRRTSNALSSSSGSSRHVARSSSSSAIQPLVSKSTTSSLVSQFAASGISSSNSQAVVAPKEDPSLVQVVHVDGVRYAVSSSTTTSSHHGAATSSLKLQQEQQQQQPLLPPTRRRASLNGAVPLERERGQILERERHSSHYTSAATTSSSEREAMETGNNMDVLARSHQVRSASGISSSSNSSNSNSLRNKIPHSSKEQHPHHRHTTTHPSASNSSKKYAEHKSKSFSELNASMSNNNSNHGGKSSSHHRSSRNNHDSSSSETISPRPPPSSTILSTAAAKQATTSSTSSTSSTITALPYYSATKNATATAMEVSKPSDDTVRNLRAQRLREAAMIKRTNSSQRIIMEENQGSSVVPEKLTIDNNSTIRSPSISPQQLAASSQTISPKMAAIATTTTTSPSSLLPPSSSSLPKVNQFLLQRKSSININRPPPATMAGRSKTEPMQQQHHYSQSSLFPMSSLTRSFDLDSDSSSEDDQDEDVMEADDHGSYNSGSESDGGDESGLQDWSVRVSIVSAVDLPANVVPNLPLSPVIRVGLVRITPPAVTAARRASVVPVNFTPATTNIQSQAKQIMAIMETKGLNAIPKARVRTTAAKVLSKRDNGAVEFHEEMRWDNVRHPEEIAVAIELSSRAVMTPGNIKESPPPQKAPNITLKTGQAMSTGSVGRNTPGLRQGGNEHTMEGTARANLAALGSLFKRPGKQKEIETATAAAAVAQMLVDPDGTDQSKMSTLRPLNQSEVYVKLRRRKPTKKKMKMTEDLHIGSQVVPLSKLPLRKALTGKEPARIEQWIELDGSYGAASFVPSAGAPPLANKRNPSILLEITFCTPDRLDESEDDMDDGDDMVNQLKASYAKRQSLKVRSQLKEESAKEQAKNLVKQEPELIPGVIDFVCVVGARDVGDQKHDDGASGWVNSNPECCILERFPPDDTFHQNKGRSASLPDKVEWFCFPDSCRLWRGVTPPNSEELNLQRFSASSPANIATSIASFDACLGCTTSFTWFVLSSNSDEYGSEIAKTYGAAIRFFVPAPKGIDPTQDDFGQAFTDGLGSDEYELPDGKRLWVPMAVMIVSRLPIIGTMEVMLLRMCEALGNVGIPGEHSGYSHFLHKELASLIVAYQRPIPGVVHCSVPFLAGDHFHIALPPAGGLPALPHGNSVAAVCRLLGPDGLNFLLSAFLTECKILIHSNDMANLCLVAEVMTALIYPFTWTLPYVPVLPTEMMELIEAPLSYLIGIPSCNIGYIDPRQLEDVVVIDLDKDFSASDFIESREDGLRLKSSTPLPASVASNISKAVYRLLRTDEENEDNVDAIPGQRSFPRMESESKAEREFRVAVAMEVCGLLRGFQDCLVYASSSRPVFNVDRFLQIAPALFEEQRGTAAQGSQELTQVLSPRSRRFMSLLVNCQHFHQFLETLDTEQAAFFREIMATAHGTTRRVGRSGLDFHSTQNSLCEFLQKLEDKVPTYRVSRVFGGTGEELEDTAAESGTRWPIDLLQSIATTNDSFSTSHTDGGVKQISVEYLVELEKNPWRYQTLFDIHSVLVNSAPINAAAQKVKLKDAIGERRYQAWKLALEQEKFDVDDPNALTNDARSANTHLDLNSLFTSASDDIAPLSSNPWDAGMSRSSLLSAQQRLQDAKDRDVLRRCIEKAMATDQVKSRQTVLERGLLSEAEVALRNPSARKFLLIVLNKRTQHSAEDTKDKRRPSPSGASKLSNSAFDILLQLGCAFLDVCLEVKEYDSAYAILKLTAGIYAITDEKENVAVSYMTARLGMHPIYANMGVWEKAKDLHVGARKDNFGDESMTEDRIDSTDAEDDDEYEAAVATLYEMLGYGIPSEELARFATRVNEINGWHRSERGQSLLMLARRLSVRREHGAGVAQAESKSDLEMISPVSSAPVRPYARPAVRPAVEGSKTGKQTVSNGSGGAQVETDDDFEWIEIGWCHPAAQSSRRMNTGGTQDSRRPGGTSSLLSMLDETKINADAAKQNIKHMKRSAITSMAYLGSSVVVTGGIDGGVFLARKTFPSAESSHVADGVESNAVCGVHLDWGSSGSRYTVGSTSTTLDGEYGVGAVTCLATTCSGNVVLSRTDLYKDKKKDTLDSQNDCLDDEDLLFAMEGRRVVAGTTCGDLRVWSIKDVFSSVFYSNQENENSMGGSIVQSHPSGAASSRIAVARKKNTPDFAAGSSLTRLKFSLRGRALSGHRGGVSCIDVPSGIYRPDSIVSGGADGLIKLWNLRSPSTAVTRMEQQSAVPTGGSEPTSPRGKAAAATGDALSILSGHGGRILCLKTAWHGDRLLSGGADRTVRLWDLAGSGGRCLHSLSGHLGWVTHVQYWGPNTIVSASTDRSIALWDARVRNTPLFMLRHHYAPISDLMVGSRTDPIMMSAASDGTVAAWDFRYLSASATAQHATAAAKNKPLHSTVAAGAKLAAAAASNKKTSSHSQTTTVRDPDGRLYLRDYSTHRHMCGPVLLSRGVSRSRDTTVQCIGNDNVIREWDYQSGDIVSSHTTGHCDLISSLKSLQDDQLYDSQLSDGSVTGTITTSWDGTVHMRRLVRKYE